MISDVLEIKQMALGKRPQMESFDILRTERHALCLQTIAFAHPQVEINQWRQ